MKKAVKPAAAKSASSVGPDEDPLAAAQREIALLHEALETSRTVGVAIGILVERHGYEPEAAFDLLVGASQREQRRVRDVATDLVRSGVFRVDDQEGAST